LKTALLALILLLSSCMTGPTHWSVDAIAAGDRIFNSSRMRYTSTQGGEHPILFEMVRVGDRIEAYISLTRFKLRSKKIAKVCFTIDSQTFEDSIPVHEGGMRLTLSEETTQKLIQALQMGHKIAILLDDFEEVLEPNEFSRSFDKFVGEAGFFQNVFKGPVP